jgi:chromate transporter
MSDLLALAWTFVRLSFLCIGGGLSAVPEMQRQAVSVHGWLSAREFVDGYALSQITPGPAMLVSTFIGYHVRGLAGALVATAAMFLPTSLLTLAVAHWWARLRERPWAQVVERSLPPVALGLMAAGVYTVGRAAVTDVPTAILALVAAVIVARRWAPTVVVVLLAGAASWLLR